MFLLALAAIPTTIGTAEAISENKRQTNDAKRSQYCGLTVYCSAKSKKRNQVHKKSVLLRDGKLFIGDAPPDVVDVEDPSATSGQGIAFNGFYINFPNDNKPMGLVSVTAVNPPAMGWIYADKNTYELKYGNRTTTLPHIMGDFDWTEDEVGVTLEGKEAFVAVEEEDDTWAIYYDRRGDFKKLPKGVRKLEISLERVFKDNILETSRDK